MPPDRETLTRESTPEPMGGYRITKAHVESDIVGQAPAFRWNLELHAPDGAVQTWTGCTYSYGQARRTMRGIVRRAVPRKERRALYRRLP